MTLANIFLIKVQLLAVITVYFSIYFVFYLYLLRLGKRKNAINYCIKLQHEIHSNKP